MKPLFNPSLMCMDLLNIKEQIEILNEQDSGVIGGAYAVFDKLG